MPSKAHMTVHPPSSRAPVAGSVATWSTVAVLVLSTGAFFAVTGSAAEGESRPAVLLAWVLAYAVAAAALLDGQLRLRRWPALPLELVLFLLLAVASAAWSVDPVLTGRRAVGLLGTVLVGLAIAQRLGAVQMLDAVRRAVLVVAVSSLLLFLSGSPAALDEVHGTLRGVLATKNTLGRVLALGLLAVAVTSLLDRSKRRRGFLSAAVMVVALALTDSTGGILLAAVVLLGTVLALLVRRRSGDLVVGAATALFAGASVLVAPYLTADRLTSAIGEDATLTGRDEVWSQSLAAVEAHAVLGHGYGAFWAAAAEAERIRSRLQWDVPHAHNGSLDAALDLGAIGVVVSALVVGGLMVRGLVDLRRKDFARAALRLSVGWLTVMSNLVESSLMQQNSLLTVLLVAAIAAPSSGAKDGDAVRTSAPQLQREVAGVGT